MTQRVLFFLFALVSVGAFARIGQAAQDGPAQPLIQDLIFDGQSFAESNNSGMALLPEGLQPTGPAATAVFTSLPIQAPIPFNAVVPQWKLDLPDGTSFHLELRTGPRPDRLGPWVDVHRAEDWTLPEDLDIVGDMVVVPAADVTHDYVQYRVSLEQGAAATPLLRELRLTFIDSTAGLPVEEMIHRQLEIDASTAAPPTVAAETDDGYPKPFVISREVWCTNPDCNYTDGLNYYPVSHLILHHTVSSTGADGDSAAVVRAIWAFHTYTRGWQDIGYNFLVDTEGVLYEGHLGGDDVVGIHASGANTGSMALALIGTYSTSKPTDPMLNSAIDLFAWKADQRDIDVFDASDTLPGIDWGLPNLMGHRDVYGTTECPGGVAHALIPVIRDEVANRIGLVSPYLFVDELSDNFSKSNANWYDGPLQCGHNAHSWYTYSTTNPTEAVNTGEWRPDIPESGRYRIDVYAPYCNTGRSETEGARYIIEHADGLSTVVANQNDRIGLWTSLGEYNLRAGTGNVIRLSDLTTTDSDRGMWFDAIRLLPLEVLPAAATDAPPDQSWLNDRSVTFTWLIDNPEKAKATVLQVATDQEFENRVVNEIWSTPVYSATISFDQDYPELYWRVVVTSASNNFYPSPASRFGLDTTPPQSTVLRPDFYTYNGVYQLFWRGQDELSGVQSYSIDVRLAGSGDDGWQSLFRDTTATSAYFKPPDPSQTYQFRSQALDRAGNSEAPKEAADMATNKARVFDQSINLPWIGSD